PPPPAPSPSSDLYMRSDMSEKSFNNSFERERNWEDWRRRERPIRPRGEWDNHDPDDRRSWNEEMSAGRFKETWDYRTPDGRENYRFDGRRNERMFVDDHSRNRPLRDDQPCDDYSKKRRLSNEYFPHNSEVDRDPRN